MSQIYYVVNTVRSIHTRLARAKAPTRHRFKQYILGGSTRLVRARPVAITDKQLLAFEDELRAKMESGAIQIHEGTPDGPLFVFGEKVEQKAEEKPKKVVPKPEPMAEVKEEVVEDEPPPPPPLPRPKRRAKKSEK